MLKQAALVLWMPALLKEVELTAALPCQVQALSHTCRHAVTGLICLAELSKPVPCCCLTSIHAGLLCCCRQRQLLPQKLMPALATMQTGSLRRWRLGSPWWMCSQTC